MLFLFPIMRITEKKRLEKIEKTSSSIPDFP